MYERFLSNCRTEQTERNVVVVKAIRIGLILIRGYTTHSLYGTLYAIDRNVQAIWFCLGYIDPPKTTLNEVVLLFQHRHST